MFRPCPAGLCAHEKVNRMNWRKRSFLEPMVIGLERGIRFVAGRFLIVGGRRIWTGSFVPGCAGREPACSCGAEPSATLF